MGKNELRRETIFRLWVNLYIRELFNNYLASVPIFDKLLTIRLYYFYANVPGNVCIFQTVNDCSKTQDIFYGKR